LGKKLKISIPFVFDQWEGLENYGSRRLSRASGDLNQAERAIWDSWRWFSLTIHLGVDIWTKRGAPVYPPWCEEENFISISGPIKGFGDYGPQPLISWKHELEVGTMLYRFYGHLTLDGFLDSFWSGTKKWKQETLICHGRPNILKNGDLATAFCIFNLMVGT